MVRVTTSTLLAVGIIFAAHSSSSFAESLTLDAAIAQNKVAFRAECLGGAMGYRMKVYVQKRVAGELQIHVTPGSVFVPRGADVQRLAAVGRQGKLTADGKYKRTAIMDLRDNQQHGYLLQIVCIDYHKNSPATGQAYAFGQVDARCRRIFSVEASATASTWAFQAAVWKDRTGVSSAKLQQTFRVKQTDLQMADTILKQAEKDGTASLASASLSVEAQAAAAGVFSANPQTRVEAHTAIQSLPAQDRAKLELILRQNLSSGARLPEAAELIAGSTLESLLPENIDLPKLQMPESVDEFIEMINQLRDAADTRPGLGLTSELAAQLRLLPQLTALRSRRPLVRLAAVRALARFQGQFAIEALIIALDDPDSRVRDTAANSLQTLTGQEFGVNRQEWEAWWQTAHESFAQ